MQSIYHLVVVNKISVWPEAVCQPMLSDGYQSIFTCLRPSCPPAPDEKQLALLLEAHLVDTWYMWPSITDMKKTVISAISWGPQASEQMLVLYISLNVCGHHHSFPLSHLLLFLCQNIPGKLFKTMWPSRWNSFWKPNELKLNQKDKKRICAKTLNLSL